jgi:hypothetical protein
MVDNLEMLCEWKHVASTYQNKQPTLLFSNGMIKYVIKNCGKCQGYNGSCAMYSHDHSRPYRAVNGKAL